MSYIVGDRVRVTGELDDSGGTNSDPSAVTVSVRAPDGSQQSYVYGTDVEVVRTGTGVYYLDVDVTQSGRYVVRFASTGTGKAAEEVTFFVAPSRI